MKIFINWLIAAAVMLITSYILPGIQVDSLLAAFITAIVLGFINAFIKPVLLILTLPINILSLGLFTLVINAGLVELTALIVPGFSVKNFWWALLFSLIVSVFNAFFSRQQTGN